MIVKILSAASAAALICGAALAEEAAQPAVDAAQAETALDAAKVTTKDDARAYGEAEFKLADADADGEVSQEEFIAYATAQMLAANEAQGEDIEVASLATDAEGAEMTETEAPAMEEAGEEPADASAPTPQDLFAALADGEKTLNEKSIVKARLASFDEADANDDETLDENEKAAFAALVWGRKAS